MRQHTPENDKKVEDFIDAIEEFVQEQIVNGKHLYYKRENMRITLFKLLDIDYP